MTGDRDPFAVGGKQPPASLAADDRLIAAERELLDELAAVDTAHLRRDDDEAEARLARVWALDELITATPTETLVGAAVKLRRLLDPELGMPIGDKDTDEPTLRVILGIVEREIDREAQRAIAGVCDAAGAAAVDFEAIDNASLLLELSQPRWGEMVGQLGVFLRVAAVTVGKTKPELVVMVRGMIADDDDLLPETLDHLADTEKQLKALAEIAVAASTRLLIAASVVALDETLPG